MRRPATRARSSTTRSALWPVLAGLLACTPPQGDTEDTEGTETGEVFEEPEFLEPANDEATLPANRTNDLELQVRGIRPGLTTVLVDGHSVGTGQDPSGAALLTPDMLTLRLTGALVPGQHSLRMHTTAPDALLESGEVLLTVVPGPPANLSATLEDTVLFEADMVMGHGHGERGVLIGLDLSTDPARVHLTPAADTGWALDDTLAFDLPAFDRSDEPEFSVSAGIHREDDSARLRIVWRSGVEGRVLLGSDMPWPPPSLHIQRVVDLEDGFDAFEYGRLGRPLLLGDTLVVEALLTGDVEDPKPGDRTLIVAHIDPERARFGPPQRSAVGGGRDIDRIGPVRDPFTHSRGGVPGLAARTAGLQTSVYEVDASTGTLSERASGNSDRFASLTETIGVPQAVLGPLRGRTVFAPLQADEPRVFLRQFDDRVGKTSTDIGPPQNTLSVLGDVTGPITSTVLGGRPVFLVPQGVDTPVVAILTDGGPGRAVALDPLACDALAVPVGEAATEQLEVACLRGHEVFRGTLELEEDT